MNQLEIDNLMKELDGTDNKGKLGANAMLAVSLAVAKVPFKVYYCYRACCFTMVLLPSGGQQCGSTCTFRWSCQ